MHDVAIVGKGEKALVFPVVDFGQKDRAVELAAELVADELRLIDAVAIGMEIVRADGAVAMELVERAVQRVGSGFLNSADDGARAAAIFGAEAVGENAELGDRFEGRSDVETAFAEIVVVIGAIQQVRGARFASAARGGTEIYALRDLRREKRQIEYVRVRSGVASTVRRLTVVARSEVAVCTKVP